GAWRILGDAVTVERGRTAPVAPLGRSDGVLTVASRGAVAAGDNGELTLDITDAHGRPVRLGTYLGAYAHVTAFRRSTGAVTHLHPLGTPQFEGSGTTLSFHTQFEQPGAHVAFVQVR